MIHDGCGGKGIGVSLWIDGRKWNVDVLERGCLWPIMLSWPWRSDDAGIFLEFGLWRTIVYLRGLSASLGRFSFPTASRFDVLGTYAVHAKQ
jgi:hypothetical protein